MFPPRGNNIFSLFTENPLRISAPPPLLRVTPEPATDSGARDETPTKYRHIFKISPLLIYLPDANGEP